jgi:arylsulfatase A-like enzyme
MKLKEVPVRSLLIAGMMFFSLAQGQTDSPNIILILTDDQGWSHVSKPMNPEIPESCSQYLSTPNIDKLGDSGMRFTSGYAPAPICTPTRRSILCGASAARSGTEFKSEFLPADHMTIPVAFKQANPAYLCAHFGKWGEHMISTPKECGYDKSDGETGNHTGGMPRSLGVESHDKGPDYFIDEEDPKLTFSVTDSAITFMNQAVEESRPFYLQVSYYATHLSIVCRQETLLKYYRKGVPDRMYPRSFAAMLDDLDQGIGGLLEALEQIGIADNTYVFFMSDNGGQEFMPGNDESRLHLNAPLSDFKQTLFEGGIRVPFIVRGPGIKPGSYSHVPIVGYDLLPTFYDLAGGVEALPDEIDGGSIVPLFYNPADGKVKRDVEGLIFHRPRESRYNRSSSAIRQGSYKLFIEWDHSGEIKKRNLYNLDENIVENENTDISEHNKEKANYLQGILLDYLKELNAEEYNTSFHMSTTSSPSG